MFSALKKWANRMKRDVLALYLAGRDPRIHWHVKLLAAAIAAYAISPVDLIPDFIPVLGYLDDVIILPSAVWFVLRLLPVDIMTELRIEATRRLENRQPRSMLAAAIIVIIWVSFLLLINALLWNWYSKYFLG